MLKSIKPTIKFIQVRHAEEGSTLAVWVSGDAQLDTQRNYSSRLQTQRDVSHLVNDRMVYQGNPTKIRVVRERAAERAETQS